jgi:uncharacterized protein (TIGR04255 family)
MTGRIQGLMANRSNGQPDFAHPPLVETALGVQFEPLAALDVPHIGLLWQSFAEHLPVTQQQAPLVPMIERIGGRNLGGVPALRISPQAPLPRCWFLNKEGDKLVQVQQDRFIWNWRKTADDAPYPRYVDTVRPHFVEHFDKFLEFLEAQAIGKFKPNQCEVIYVNHIVSGEVWKSHEDLAKVFIGWNQSYGHAMPLPVENIRLKVDHLIYGDEQDFIGRLHIEIDPAFRSSDDRPIVVVKLTARGKPMTQDRSGVLQFLDLGREYIVRSFEALTTPQMHELWGKRA